MKKCKFVVVLIALVLAFGVFSGFTYVESERNNPNDDVTAKSATQAYAEENFVEVVSYVDVFRAYYDVVLEASKKTNWKEIMPFEDFCSLYYYVGLDIWDYTDAVISCHELGIDVNELVLVSDDSFVSLEADIEEQSIDRSSGDADYILSSYWYSYTPQSVFARAPRYGAFSFSGVWKGDIIIETKTILDLGHAAIISNLSKSGYYGSYIETIDAVGGGVQYGFLDDTRMVEYGIVIFGVIGATSSICDNAVDFSLSQIGKPYFLNPFRTNTSITSSNWYCSELVYAAYLYAGINLNCINGLGGVYPVNIYNSSKVFPVLSYTDRIIYLSIEGKTLLGKWTIRVKHYQGGSPTVWYNTKMCFENDAKFWNSNLTNKSSKTVTSGVTGQTFEINENYFATHVAFMMQYGSRKVTTYADQLNNTTKTLNTQYYCI